APGQGVAGLLGLQRLAGNRAARDLLRAVQRVTEDPIHGGAAKEATAVDRKAARIGSLVAIRKGSGPGWDVDSTATPSRMLDELAAQGSTFVTAFVQPFAPAYRGEVWLFPRGNKDDKVGGWGQAIGSHDSAQGVSAMAAGEAKWTIAKQ